MGTISVPGTLYWTLCGSPSRHRFLAPSQPPVLFMREIETRACFEKLGKSLRTPRWDCGKRALEVKTLCDVTEFLILQRNAAYASTT